MLDISLIDNIFIVTQLSDNTKVNQLHNIVDIFQYNANDNLGTPPNLKLVDRFNTSVELDTNNVTSISGVPFSGSYTDLYNAVVLFQKEMGDKPSPKNIVEQYEFTDPLFISFTGFKKLSFVAEGAISVIGNTTIIYPQMLGNLLVAGATFEADSATAETITFDGIGKVLITLQK